MRLTSIDLTQFKAFEEVSLEIAPFTVLIGPNNAGKSSVLQALALLSQSTQTGSLVSFGPMVDLGPDLSNLTHMSNGQRASGESWTIDVGWEDARNDVSPIHVGFRVMYTVAASELRTQATVSLEMPRGRNATVSAGFPDQQPTIEVAGGAGTGGPIRPMGGPPISPWSFLISYCPPMDLPAAETGDLEAVRAYACNTAQPYLAEIGQALQTYRYIGPDRAVEQSIFPLGGRQTDYPRSANDILNTLAYDRTLLRRVSDRCERVFGYGIDIDLVPDRQVSLVATGPMDFRANIVNLGSGFIQLVWILVHLELALIRSHSSQNRYTVTVGIEEPELHLHPRVQPDIARVLADYVQQGSQVICTTQSEHFLMALLQMVLSGELDKGQLSVYYVDQGTARHLDVDEQGRLSEGLRGFFEANEQQLLRHMELLMRRD